MKIGVLLLLAGGWTSLQSADISVPGGTLRIASHSQVRVSDGQVEVTRGTLTYEVQDAGAAQVEILTPSVSAKAFEQGVYRIAIRKSGESEITAQAGRMVVTAPNGEQWLEPGQKMIARGPRGNPEFRIVSAVGWWKRLAGMLQNMQIGGGGGVSTESRGGESAAAAKESHSKPKTESAAVPSGSAHPGADRPKTSDGHSNPSHGGAHSGDSRPVSIGGGASHAAAAPASGGSSRASESHTAPASASHGSDSSPRGK